MRKIAVIGATGHQGGGVVSALLSSSAAVKAITSNLGSVRAAALLAKHSDRVTAGTFELVEANLDDRDSLEQALEGCTELFASFGPGPSPVEGETAQEVLRGINLVQAAKSVGIQHFVYSSLTSTKEESKGKYTEIHHHESKGAVEKYAKEHLDAVTTIVPGAFYSNLDSIGWARRDRNGSAVFCAPFDRKTRLAWTDADFDVGNFALAIFDKGPLATKGKSYLCVSRHLLSIEELAAEYHAVTGEDVKVDPLSVEAGAERTQKDLGGSASLARELEAAFAWFNEAYNDLPADALDGPTHAVREALGVSVSTFRQYLERSGWRVKSRD
ncbi:hypothetical protein JCM11491_005077 [Sporobolomyces phaffii]